MLQYSSYSTSGFSPTCTVNSNRKAVSKMTDEKIQRINELARKSKTPEGLTEAEKAEQQQLRNEYRQSIVSNLSAQLDNCSIVDEKGNIIKKVQKVK